MENKKAENYISLSEAAKLCAYTQEYLSLRARQGKLRAEKIGRNWVTTKEWLEEYYIHNENKNENEKTNIAFPISGVDELIATQEQEVGLPPENLPVGELTAYKQNSKDWFYARQPVRISLLVSLTISLIMAGGIFGKSSLADVYDDAAPIAQKIRSNFNELTIAAIAEVGRQTISIDGREITIEATAQGISNEFSKAIYPASRIANEIFENFSRVNNSLKKIAADASSKINEQYNAANKIVDRNIEKGLAALDIPFRRIYEFITAPWQSGITSVTSDVTSEEIAELKAQLEQLKQEPVVVKRVEVSRIVEPVKEVTKTIETEKRITKIDDSALAQIRSTLTYLEGEIGKRLYAPGGVISQTIRVTEPVQSPKIYQENGDIVLQTLGSGNVILTAATGLHLYGQQVVVESTNTLNPMIYLASKTRIGGDTTITGATSVGGTLSAGGNLSTQGNLTVVGDLTVSGSGSQSFNGPMTITASSTSPTLTVVQNGSGDILNLKDGSTEVFTVLDGGNIGVASTTPSNTFSVQGNIISSGDVTFYGANSTTTIAGGLVVDTNTLYLDPYINKVGISTTTPRYTLDVWGDLSIGTSTDTNTPLLYVDSGTGGAMGIGTSTVSSNFLTVGTTTEYLVIDRQGNIGIATSTISTAYKLSVNGQLYTSATTTARGIDTTAFKLTTNPTINYVLTSNANGYGTWQDANSVYPNNWQFIGPNAIRPTSTVGIIVSATSTFAGDLTVGSELLFVDVSAGTIGIATTTPRYTLDVWGDLVIGTSSGTGAPQNYPMLYVQSGTDGSNGVGIGTTTVAGTLLTVGTTTSAFVVTSAGNVGIGTAAPGANLDVNPSGNALINAGTWGSISGNGDGRALFATNFYTQSGSVYKYTVTHGSIGYAGIDLNSGIIKFFNATGATTKDATFTPTETMRITNTGNVGIGTAGPSSKLTVFGGDLAVGNGVATSTILNGSITLDYGISAATSTFTATSTFASINADSGLLYVDSYLNRVAIATSTPRYTLDVWGDLAVGTSTATSSTAVVPGLYVNSGNGLQVGIGTTTVSDNLLTVGTTTPAFIINSKGLIGMGTTTVADAYQLSIQGQLYTSATTTIADGLVVGGSDLYVSSNGNVGIGTTAPVAKLHIENSTTALLRLERTGSRIWDFDLSSGYLQIVDRTANTTPITIEANVPNNILYLTTTNRIGIATTTPRYTLDVWGDLVIGTSSGTGAPQNYPMLYVQSGTDGSNGVGIGTTTVAGAMLTVGTSTPSFIITSTGAVAVATTTPGASFAFAVGGQCVTGDTRLRRRRRRKDGEYIYDGVMIKDIQPGDEIASLDENTGKVVYRKVNALLDMGVKEIFKLTTGDGRTIRTTINHPYLTKNGWTKVGNIKIGEEIAAPQSKPKVGVFIDNANLFYAQRRSGWKIDFAKVKGLLNKSLSVEFFNYYAAIPAPWDDVYKETVNYFDKIKEIVSLKLKPLKYIFAGKKLVDKKGDVDLEIALDVARNIDKLDIVVVMSGDSDYLELKNYVLEKGKKIVFLGLDKTMAWELRKIKHLLLDSVRQQIELGVENKTTPEFDLGRLLLDLVYRRDENLSRAAAVDKGKEITWAKVVSIEKVGEEQVYDIEVEGTHNFIGNDIFAHNTYMSATTTIADGLVVGGSDLYVSSNGNVGIGTTAPTQKLHVAGNILGTGNNNSIGPTSNISTDTILSVRGSLGVDGFRAGDFVPTQTASVANTYGLYTRVDTSAAAITASNIYGIQIDAPTKGAGSTITTAYGLYIGNQTAGSTNYSIYSNGGQSYFAGNVGIATTTPRYTLDVWGDLVVGTSSGTGAPQNYPMLYVQSGTDGSNGVGIGTTTVAGAMLTVGTTTPAFVVSSTGNVGIGTTAPGAKLDVQGSILLGVAGSSSGRTTFRSSGTGETAPYIETNAGSDLALEAPSGWMSYNVASGLGHLFRINSDEKVRIDSSGNVGIATTTPRYTLDVWGDLSIGTSTDTNTPLLYVDSGTGGAMGIGTSTVSSNFLTIGTTTEYLVIDRQGNIGIATSTISTAYKLSVNGQLYTSATTTARGIDTTAFKLTTNPTINYVLTSNANGYGTWQDANSVYPNNWQFIGPNAIRPTSTVGIIVSATSTFAGDLTVGSELLFVDVSAGTVGIATSTPRYTLDVWGDMAIGTSTDTNTPALYVNSGNGGRIGIGTTTLAGLLTVGTTTPALVINETGNVFAYGGMYQNIYGSDDGLVLYFPFSEGMTSSTAIKAYDRSPYGNDGTLTFMATTTPSPWVTSTDSVGGIPCKTGTCLSFDGLDDYISTPLTTLTTAATQEAWIKTNSLQTARGRIIANGGGRWGIDRYNTGNIEAYVSTASGNNNIIRSITDGEWTHVVSVYDGTGGSLKLYINGALAGSVGGVGGVIEDIGSTVTIGGDGAGFPFRGLIDEVRIYNRALSADEVRVHYLRGTNANGTILANNFRVVNTTNNVIFRIDSSGNATTSGSIQMSDDKWIGLGSNAGRLVFDDQSTDYLTFQNAYVGIATSSPRYTLDVWGDLVIGTSSGTGAPQNYPMLYVQSGTDGSNGVGIGTTTVAGAMLTVGTTTPALVVSSNGNVGIGTTAPLSTLEVAASKTINFNSSPVSNLTLGTNMAAGGYNITNAGSFISGTIYSIYNSGDTSIGMALDNAATAGKQIVFQTRNTANSTYLTRLAIGTVADTTDIDITNATLDLNNNLITNIGHADTDFTSGGGLNIAGQVGIGTSTPRYTLDVWGDLAVGTSTATSSTAVVPGLYVNSGNGLQVGIGTTTVSDNLLTVGTTTPAFIINSKGLIGMGTTTVADAYQLSIQGQLYTSATTTIADGLVVGGSDLYVSSNGNVGIGTTAPVAKLHIENSTAALLRLERTGVRIWDFDLSSGYLQIIDRTANTTPITIEANVPNNILYLTTTNRIGIATTTPRYTLDVWGDLVIGTSSGTGAPQNYPMLYVQSGTDGSNGVGIGTTTVAGTMLTVGTTTPALVVSNTGRVGIGKVAPAYGLDVVADINSDDCFREAGTQVAGTCASDIALKQNIQPLSGSLEKILALKPVEFEWQEGIEELGSTIRYVEGRQVGLIAQDVQEVLPHLVIEKEGYLSVRYNLELQMLMINAIQEQQEQIKELRARLGLLSVEQNENGQIVNLEEQQILASVGLIVNEFGVLEVGTLKTQELCVGNVCVTEEDFVRVFGSPASDAGNLENLQNGASQPCGSEVGVCQVGVQIYQDGIWGECIGAVLPSDEIMDGVDNNCDGQTDEGVQVSAPEPEAASAESSGEPMPEPEPVEVGSDPTNDTSSDTTADSSDTESEPEPEPEPVVEPTATTTAP